MEDWQKRAEHGAMEAAGSLVVTLALTRGWDRLGARREARGRRKSTMLATNKVVILVLCVGLLIGNIAYYNSNRKFGIDTTGAVIEFILIALFGFLAVLAVATIITLLVFSFIELFDTAAGTQVSRPGHFLTLEEVYALGEAVSIRINKLEGNLLGDAALAFVGAGGALGVDLAHRDRAIGELKKLQVLEAQILAGEPVWVND